MSYRGRPSKGCESCRGRKVKCDEAKPICGRCNKLGHDCKYRDQADLLFRDQTAYAAQKAGDSWRKRSKSQTQARANEAGSSPEQASPNDSLKPPRKGHGRARSRSSVQLDVSTSQSSGSASKSTPEPTPDFNIPPQNSSPGSASIPPEIPKDVKRLAWERLLYDFFIPDSPDNQRTENGASDALWTFVPVLCQEAPPDSALIPIVNALAYTNFAHRCACPQAESLADECLGKGIALLSKSIADKKLAKTNEVLCAAYLMGMYENLSTRQRKGTFMIHQKAVSTLLNLRTSEQHYSDPVSARLYEVMYAQSLLSSLQGAIHPTMPMKDDPRFFNREKMPECLTDVSITRLVYEITKLHAQWTELKESNVTFNSRLDLQEMMQAFFSLDGQLQVWETRLPPEWRPRTEPNTPQNRAKYNVRWRELLLESPGAPDEIQQHLSLKKCWIWHYFRTSLIFLLRDLQDILERMIALPDPDPLYMAMDSLNLDPSLGIDPSVNPQANRIFTGLETATLQLHRVNVQNRLVDVVNAECASIIANFTVYIPTKSPEDPCSMSAYTLLWPLGVIVTMLSYGIGPCTPSDAGSPASATSGASPASIDDLSSISPYIPQTSSSDAPTLAKYPPPRSLMSSLAFEQSWAADPMYAKPFDVQARLGWAQRILHFIAMEMGIKKALNLPGPMNSFGSPGPR